MGIRDRLKAMQELLSANDLTDKEKIKLMKAHTALLIRLI